MTNTNKTTYITALDYALNHLTDAPAEIMEKLAKLREQTEKRNSADRKPTKAQLANEALKDKVYAVLTTTPCTVSELMTRDPDLAALSNQKVSALVNALCDDGRAVKGTDKRKSVFSLAA